MIGEHELGHLHGAEQRHQEDDHAYTQTTEAGHVESMQHPAIAQRTIPPERSDARNIGIGFPGLALCKMVWMGRQGRR